MKCKDAYLFICENLDQQIDSPACREIRMHLEECENCTSYLESVKETIRLYKVAPVPRVSEAARERLLQQIKLMKPVPTRGR